MTSQQREEFGADARVPLFNKHLDAGIHFLGGDGIRH